MKTASMNTMKIALLAVFFAFIVMVSGKPRPESSENRCSSSDDCSENECCIAKGWFGMRKGHCEPLSEKGEACSPFDEVIGPFTYKKYENYCPCAAYLSCEPTEVQDLGAFGKVLMNERCVPIADETTTSETATGTEEVTTSEDTVTPEEETTETGPITLTEEVTESEEVTEAEGIETLETRITTDKTTGPTCITRPDGTEKSTESDEEDMATDTEMCESN